MTYRILATETKITQPYFPSFDTVFSLVIVLPHIDPNIISIGGFGIKWYALSYIIGILFSYYFTAKTASMTQTDSDTLLLYAGIGVLAGGRLGYMLFYNFEHYMHNPIEILMIWHGGMAFHGAALGVIAGIYLFCRKTKHSFLKISDPIAASAGLGIMLGRISNFINSELLGRETQISWAVDFGDKIPRHPSQLYESILEGLLPFILLQILFLKKNLKKGLITGIWLIMYGMARIFVENFREPDIQIGYFLHFFTLGQILSLPILIAGYFICYYSLKRKNSD